LKQVWLFLNVLYVTDQSHNLLSCILYFWGEGLIPRTHLTGYSLETKSAKTLVVTAIAGTINFSHWRSS